MTTRMFLVRHGATVLSAEDRFAGSTNVALSDRGRAQAAALGARLRGERVTAIYASPLDRAMETARLIAEPHRLEVAHRDGLREIDHGRWEGLARKDVERRFADEYASWERDPFTSAPEGGETGLSVMARALPVLREIVLHHEGEAVVVVSHKATLRLVLCSLLGMDARGYRDRFDQSPACLNIVDFCDPVRARLMLFNDVSHYEDRPDRPGAQLSSWWRG